MKTIVCIIALTFAGCTQLDAARDSTINTTAVAADHALVDAELVMCRGITVGAWQRAYGQNPVRAQAWKTLCSVSIQQTP